MLMTTIEVQKNYAGPERWTGAYLALYCDCSVHTRLRYYLGYVHSGNKYGQSVMLSRV